MSSARGVIGTAGHIDHGKTELVRALTGIDTDRLKEEKARGITIELGFAHLTLPNGRVVGVVDVPGHERFVRTMVAGAVGVDVVVLVVAADEGVMPQTREHIDICGLLGVRRGVVALTKADLVDDEMRELAESDVRDALAGTFLEDAPIVSCSAKVGMGLVDLTSAIEAALEADGHDGAWPTPMRDELAPVRLPIDRAFSLKGFGSVVTGTLWSGRIRVGDELALADGAHGKVRGLHVHGAALDEVYAGTRVAVNVALPLEVLPRGAMLGEQLEAGRVFDAALRILPTTRRALRKRQRALLHAGTTQVDAIVRLLERDTVAPGEEALVEIETHAPLVLWPGDRFVLRGTTPQKGYGTTIGGGVVLRVLGSRSRRGRRTDPALLQRNLDAQRSGDVATRIALEIDRAGVLDRVALTRRVPYARFEDALDRLRSQGEIVRFDRERDAHVSKRALLELERAAQAVVEQHGSIARESLRAHVTDDPKLLHLVVERLVRAGVIRAERDRLMALEAAPTDDGGAALLELLQKRGLEPPRHVDLPALLGRSVDAALTRLAREGQIVRTSELSFSHAAIDTLQARLVAHLEAHGEIDAQGWKTLTGVSRKFTIPLAEHFDAIRVTLRVGDKRKLRK